jgi:UDP-N-acetylmuramoylalanine--D-glutamate ligase
MKRVVVLGGRESGVGAAILAKQQGYDVFVSDKGEIPEIYKNELDKYKLDWEEKKHTEAKILNANVVIKSPGIPDTISLIIKLKKNGISVISEIELASQFSKAKVIGITGSNGKTTTSTLTYQMLKNSGLNVGLAGNVGDSYARQVALDDKDIYVLELSSFQLDGIEKFRPDIAVLMNISEDHLDRYDNKFQNYVNSKFRIAKNQTENDYFIFCEDDQTIQKNINSKKIKSKQISFSVKKKWQKVHGSIKENYLYISTKPNLI